MTSRKMKKKVSISLLLAFTFFIVSFITLKDYGITTLISGDIGPGATTILEALGIEIYHTNSGKLVKKVIEDWLTKNN